MAPISERVKLWTLWSQDQNFCLIHPHIWPPDYISIAPPTGPIQMYVSGSLEWGVWFLGLKRNLKCFLHMASLLCRVSVSEKNRSRITLSNTDSASMNKRPCYPGSLSDDVTKCTVSNCICGKRNMNTIKTIKPCTINGLSVYSKWTIYCSIQSLLNSKHVSVTCTKSMIKQTKSNSLLESEWRLNSQMIMTDQLTSSPPSYLLYQTCRHLDQPGTCTFGAVVRTL